jgi:hypothetical protein
VHSQAARTKARFTIVAVWAVCASDGISLELPLWPPPLPPLPNSAVPITAMPMAAPIRCAVISAPPAVPAWPLGTEPSTKSWFGAMTRPLPSPARNSGPIRAQTSGLGAVRCSTSSTRASPANMAARPPCTVLRPNRVENL